jgi:hypothetical protein
VSSYPSPPPPPPRRRDPLLIWVIVGSVLALLLCGGVVTASYIAYQRGGEVVPVAAENAEPPAAETAKACTDATDLRAHLVPAPGPESGAPAAATDNDLVVTLYAAFSGAPAEAVRDSLAAYKFVCGAVRTWPAAGGATADVQLVQFANRVEALNYFTSRVLPYKDEVAAADLLFVKDIDYGIVVTRKGTDGRMHAMGFTLKGAVLVVAEIYGKNRPDATAVGDLLRQQLEKA